MKLLFEASFARDLRGIRDRPLRQRIQRVIDEVKKADGVGAVRGIRQLQGYQTF